MTRSGASRYLERTAGFRTYASLLFRWEEAGLLRRHCPGRRIGARYDAVDLLRARAVIELRRRGEPLDRVRTISSAIARQGAIESDERVVVDRAGRVVFVRGDAGDLERFAVVLPIGSWFQAARDAAEERFEVCSKKSE